MKGMVGLCYDMPQWEAYLGTSDVEFNEAQRIQLENAIHDFLSDAALELVEENRLHLMKKLHDFLENEEVFAGSCKVFRRMPPMPEEIVFDTDISTFLEEEMSLEAGYEMPGNNINAQRYVILDDLNDVLPEQEDHFIRINPIVGITEKDAEKAVEIINQ